MLKLGKFFLNLKILFKEKLIVAISLKNLPCCLLRSVRFLYSYQKVNWQRLYVSKRCIKLCTFFSLFLSSHEDDVYTKDNIVVTICTVVALHNIDLFT